MEKDPFHINFYKFTGAYTWQLIEYYQHNIHKKYSQIELKRSKLPILEHAYYPYPERLNPEADIYFSKNVCIVKNMSAIFGIPSIEEISILSERSKVFINIDVKTYDNLKYGQKIREMFPILLNGKRYSSSEIYVTLLRHGILETNQLFFKNIPSGIIREPTCIIVTFKAGYKVINPLNGRAFLVDAQAKNFLNKLSEPHTIMEWPITNLSDTMKNTLCTFIEAGILRLF
ncbi:hypothetical protein ACMX04_02265 [Bartonella bacilliformis]|uniref:hypothetical protein n=1 Tax=Bartonella bacilliformis TaxID=774 RepID=UPI0039E52843